jgi:hypothetical protein
VFVNVPLVRVPVRVAPLDAVEMTVGSQITAMLSVLLMVVGPAPKVPEALTSKMMPPVEVSEVVPSPQLVQVAVPLRAGGPVTATEAGDAFGAPDGEKILLGNGAEVTVTVKAPVCFDVREAPTLTVYTSVAAAEPVVNRMLTVAPGSTVAVPGEVGIAVQVVPLSTENSGVPPVVAKLPQMKDGELVPEIAKVGSTVVTVFGVVDSVLGLRVKALGVRFITNDRVVVTVPSVKPPVIVALPGESPQRPELATFTHRVCTVSPLTTA